MEHTPHPVYKCVLGVGTVSIHNLFSKFCVPLGSQKTLCSSFFNIVDQIGDYAFSYYMDYILCLCKKIARTEHAINLLLAEVAGHDMHASMVFTSVTERI
jgi:hypothetical protein